jgi:hypothetical protein
LTLSHPSKKTSILLLEEYYRLLGLYHDAYDRIHFAVMNELSEFGIPANSRDHAVHRLKQLLPADSRVPSLFSNGTIAATYKPDKLSITC